MGSAAASVGAVAAGDAGPRFIITIITAAAAPAISVTAAIAPTISSGTSFDDWRAVGGGAAAGGWGGHCGGAGGGGGGGVGGKDIASPSLASMPVRSALRARQGRLNPAA